MGPMQGNWGSIDFNSISAGMGGERGPHDDLESLGWVLCHALFGDLPWFKYTADAWEIGMWKSEAVALARCQVQQAKEQVRRKGWGSFGPRWSYLADMPRELDRFLHLCWDKAQVDKCCWLAGADEDSCCPPDYQELAALLGGQEGLENEEMERLDLEHFNEEVVPLLDLADLRGG